MMLSVILAAIKGVFAFMWRIIKLTFKVFKFIIFVIGVYGLMLILSIFAYHDAQFSSLSNMHQDVKQIYRNVALASDQMNKIPNLVLLEGDYTPNMYVNLAGVHVTSGMYEMLRHNPDAMALVLGHEIAHKLLNHLHPAAVLLGESSQSQELMADGYGAFLAAKAGYDVCKGARYFLERRAVYGDSIDSTHPSHVFRYVHLQMAYCS